MKRALIINVHWIAFLVIIFACSINRVVGAATIEKRCIPICLEDPPECPGYVANGSPGC